MGDAPARRPRRRDHQDRGSGRRRATSAATCRRSRRARTRCSSRRSTAARGASRSISGIRRRAACSRTSCACATRCTRTFAATSRGSSGSPTTSSKGVNPAIVCCSLSGFGMTGPRASEGGYDYMMQGLAGWQSLTGEPGGPPTKSGLSLVDLSGGYASAIAHARGHLARATRRGRLRLRRVAVRDGAARVDVHRPVGGDARVRAAAAAQLRSPDDRALPELRGRRTAGSSSARRSRRSGSGCAT